MMLSHLRFAFAPLCKRGEGGICECAVRHNLKIPLSPPFAKGEAGFDLPLANDGRVGR